MTRVTVMRMPMLTCVEEQDSGEEAGDQQAPWGLSLLRRQPGSAPGADGQGLELARAWRRTQPRRLHPAGDKRSVEKPPHPACVLSGVLSACTL